MSNPQPYSPTKERALRRAALLQGPRALGITVASAVRQTYSAGSAYDTVDYDSLDEDTIEMVLSPEDMQLLSRAAEEALAEIRADRAAAVQISTLTPVETLTPAKPAATETLAASEIRVPDLKATARSNTLPPDAAKLAVSAETPVTAPSITTTRPAAAQAPVAAAPAWPTSSRARRRFPVRLLGMIGVIAVTAVALASMAHHAPQTEAVPVTAPASVQPATPAPASAPAPATQIAIPGLAAAAPAAAVATPAPISLPGPVSAPRPALPAMRVVTSGPTAPEPVRVKNPFDRSEVFEFPAGTNLEEARQSVADILMQRARERGIQPMPAGDGRIAKPLSRY